MLYFLVYRHRVTNIYFLSSLLLLFFAHSFERIIGWLGYGIIIIIISEKRHTHTHTQNNTKYGYKIDNMFALQKLGIKGTCREILVIENDDVCEYINGLERKEIEYAINFVVKFNFFYFVAECLYYLCLFRVLDKSCNLIRYTHIHTHTTPHSTTREENDHRIDDESV